MIKEVRAHAVTDGAGVTEVSTHGAAAGRHRNKPPFSMAGMVGYPSNMPSGWR
jgi:hypothetical protein